MSSRLADRLGALRRQRFVGRESERALFRSALGAPHLPFNVLHVYGPGGVGKTTLLREFAVLAAEAGATAAQLDVRNVEPAPEAFQGALAAALGAPDAPPADTLAARGGTAVILVDTCELLRPLDAWLREEFLPQLPERTLTVLAGRDPPAEAWRSDPGWRALVRVIPLRNLGPDDVRSYLARRDVPAEQHQAVLDFTHGHPLALTLVADVIEQRPGQRFAAAESPDVIGALLERFAAEVPTSQHRAALEAAALLRVTTEPLLAEVVGVDDAGELFRWLRGVSFIDTGPLGLFPHDLARDALSADLRWRNPDRFAELHHRARGYYARRLGETMGPEQQRVLSDYVFLHRDNPLVRPFIDWGETGTTVPHPPRPEDAPRLREMVARHEGEESAEIAMHWLRRQPEGFLVIRGTHGEAAGFLCMVRLEQATAEDRRTDPAVDAALRCLETRAPLRAGERATHFRFWMSDAEYQAVGPAQSLVFLKVAQHYLTTPGLAFTFFPIADAEFWAPFFGYIDLFPVPEAAYAAGERRFTVFCHDWRAVPPLTWLDVLARRELDPAASPTPADALPPAIVPAAALDEGAFREAVQDALRCFTRPRELRASPLLNARIVLAQAGAESTDAERVPVLQSLLRRAADTLRVSPRQEKWADALRYAYFEPLSSQERAAQRLYVSFSTFRRHLKSAVDHVAETMWQWEARGSAD
ncbi:MAG TPA: ATP-binding protein [Longimicrobium sp.]|nr:ATP-binding protein [Longimicrobium sp.]